MASTSYGSVPFAEQIAFFRQKLNIPTNAWTDIYNSEHDYAFVVAGANRDDLLADFRTAVDKAIADGNTLEQFRKDFDSIVAKYGWDYNGGRNWRSNVIYDTNLRGSYGAGRYEQLQAQTSTLPYWRYRHSDAVEEPREDHLKWDNLVLRADDPWWQTHYAPNGWGCGCYVEGLTEDDLRALGKTGPDKAPPIAWQVREIGQRSPNGPITVRVPEGIDPGFEHAPGQNRLQSQVPQPLPPARIASNTTLPGTVAPDALPAARRITTDAILPAGQPAASYSDAFLREFGAQAQPAVFKDELGNALVIGADLFSATGGISASRYTPLLARTLQTPDEIYVRMDIPGDAGKATVNRYYISHYTLPGQAEPVAVAVVWGKDGWLGITSLQQPLSLAELRQGVRLYRRGD